MNKTDVINITSQYNLAPNKKFGQNFLINDGIIERILDVCSPSGKKVLEIGPGLGAISRGLASASEHYTAVEIDAGFYRYLSDLFSDSDNVKLIHSDFLKLELEDSFSLVVSNLPYYCASEILFKVARRVRAEDVYIMVQKEMAERMAAAPGSPEYGAMTVTLSYYYNISLLFHVPGECFYPKPEVKSSFLHLARIDRGLPLDFEELFHIVVKSAFWGRRKTVLTSLANAPHMDVPKNTLREVLDLAGISHSERGENLSPEQFIKITEIMKENEK